MRCPIDPACHYSFDDLFAAAHARPMTGDERDAFRKLDQPAINAWVRRAVAATRGAFACEDRTGTNGVVHTAFWAAHEKTGEPQRCAG